MLDDEEGDRPMAINKPYGSIDQLPSALPLFPLSGALLLPRGQMPLNIFEPRYMAMIDAAIATHRVIGMVQPNPDQDEDTTRPALSPVGCAGRITGLQETGDGRYLVSLTGVARFRIVDELTTLTPFRQARVDFQPFADDLVPRKGEDDVDRRALLDAFKRFLEANNMDADWKSVNEAPNEALVNALSMMAPYGPREKQALLEARTLKERGDILVAITEMTLAKSTTETDRRLN
jgi:uncharacterized protein